MKKYLKIFPLIFYPYAYILSLYITSLCGYYSLIDDGNIMVDLWIIAAIAYNLIVLIISLWSAIGGLKQYIPAETAEMNLVVKCLQIPAYTLHFIMGVVGIVMSVWGIWATAIAIIVDFLTIIFSGLFAVGVVRRLKKDGILSPKMAFLAGFCSFIFCIDLITAIVLIVICRKKRNQTISEKEVSQ